MKKDAVISGLRKRVAELSLTNLTERDAGRRLKELYYGLPKDLVVDYQTYLEATAYFVMFVVLRSEY